VAPLGGPAVCRLVFPTISPRAEGLSSPDQALMSSATLNGDRTPREMIRAPADGCGPCGLALRQDGAAHIDGAFCRPTGPADRNWLPGRCMTSLPLGKASGSRLAPNLPAALGQFRAPAR